MLMIARLSQDDVAALLAILLVVVVYAVFGLVCALLAPRRGRSPVAWFFIGVATQCIGIVLLLCLPNLKLEEERQRQRADETRRLREQLKKERQIADERHEAHRQRLGAHDRALGLDTGSAEPARLLERAPPPLPGGPEPLWFYAEGGRQIGPVTAAALRAMWRDRQVDERTLVWCEGLSNWVALADAKDLLAARFDPQPDCGPDRRPPFGSPASGSPGSGSPGSGAPGELP